MKRVIADTDGKKIKLRSLGDLDRRTSAARAALGLQEELLSDLGGEARLSAMEKALVLNAAVLGAVLADMAARYLQGEDPDMVRFSTLANAQRRLLTELGLERRAEQVEGIRAYVRGKAA